MKIGKVAKLTSLKTSIIRYWESEFSNLHPIKSPSGQRLYSKNDVALILEIKQLLYSEKLTIDGARKRLSVKYTPVEPYEKSCEQLINLIKSSIDELKSIKESF